MTRVILTLAVPVIVVTGLAVVADWLLRLVEGAHDVGERPDCGRRYDR